MNIVEAFALAALALGMFGLGCMAGATNNPARREIMGGLGVICAALAVGLGMWGVVVGLAR